MPHVSGVRANRPGALLEVNLVESLGAKRYATDSVGTVLGRGEWRQVEVTHRAHRPNATLTLEIVLPRGSPAASILVDDLEVTVHKASFMSSGRRDRCSTTWITSRPNAS